MNIFKEILFVFGGYMGLISIFGTPIAIFGLLESFVANKSVKEDLLIVGVSVTMLLLAIGIFLIGDL